MKVPFILPFIDNLTGFTYCTWALPGGLPDLTVYIISLVHYVHFRSGDLKMLCWVYIVDGVQVGRCAASAATTRAPSMKEVKREGGCV